MKADNAVYQCILKKNYILGSLHMSVGLRASEKKKPETVEFHNKIKCGADMADQIARLYLFKISIRRCSVAIFYDILDWQA